MPLLLLLLLAGCDQTPMTNEQIVAAVKYCTDNGLRSAQLMGGWAMKTVYVECRE
jgi:hypothetical protein